MSSEFIRNRSRRLGMSRECIRSRSRKWGRSRKKSGRPGVMYSAQKS